MGCCNRNKVIPVNNLERANLYQRPPVSDRPRNFNTPPKQKYQSKIDRHRV